MSTFSQRNQFYVLKGKLARLYVLFKLVKRAPQKIYHYDLPLLHQCSTSQTASFFCHRLSKNPNNLQEQWHWMIRCLSVFIAVIRGRLWCFINSSPWPTGWVKFAVSNFWILAGHGVSCPAGGKKCSDVDMSSSVCESRDYLWGT